MSYSPFTNKKISLLENGNYLYFFTFDTMITSNYVTLESLAKQISMLIFAGCLPAQKYMSKLSKFAIYKQKLNQLQNTHSSNNTNKYISETKAKSLITKNINILQLI